MARRNPMNERYKKDAKVGTTRKSAAAVKPKRSDSASTSSSSAKKSGPSRSNSRYQPVVLPPEIRRLQKISFALLGVAVVLSILYLWQSKNLGGVSSILLGVAYGCMFTALYIDFGKVRPAMKAARAGKPIPTKSSGKAASTKKTAEKPSEKSEKPAEKVEAPESESSGDEGN